jgi:hypothetical protein
MIVYEVTWTLETNYSSKPVKEIFDTKKKADEYVDDLSFDGIDFTICEVEI